MPTAFTDFRIYSFFGGVESFGELPQTKTFSARYFSRPPWRPLPLPSPPGNRFFVFRQGWWDKIVFLEDGEADESWDEKKEREESDRFEGGKQNVTRSSYFSCKSDQFQLRTLVVKVPTVMSDTVTFVRILYSQQHNV